MACHFTAGSSQFLSVASAPVQNAGTYSIVVWYKPETPFTSDYTIVSCGASGSQAQVALHYRGDLTNKPPRLSMASASSATGLSATAGSSTNTWHMTVGVFNGATSRTVYFDGGSNATDATNITGTFAFNRFFIGKTANNGTALFFNGDIGHVGIYSIALAGADVTNLWNGGNGKNCLDVQRASLTNLWDLFDITDLTDKVGGLVLTNNASVTSSTTQPPVDFGHLATVQYSFMRPVDGSMLWAARTDLVTIPPNFPTLPVVDSPYVGRQSQLTHARLQGSYGYEVDAPLLSNDSSPKPQGKIYAVDGNVITVSTPIPVMPLPEPLPVLKLVASGYARSEVVLNQTPAVATPTVLEPEPLPPQRPAPLRPLWLMPEWLPRPASDAVIAGDASTNVDVQGSLAFSNVPIRGNGNLAVAVVGTITGVAPIAGSDAAGVIQGDASLAVVVSGAITGTAAVASSIHTAIDADHVSLTVSLPVAGDASTHVDVQGVLQTLITIPIVGDASTGVAVVGLIAAVTIADILGDASTNIAVAGALIGAFTTRVGNYQSGFRTTDYAPGYRTTEYVSALKGSQMKPTVGTRFTPEVTIKNENRVFDDPNTLTLTVVSPDKVNTVYSYPADIVRVSVGFFKLSPGFIMTSPGVWTWRWHGVGGCEGATPDESVYCGPSAVTDPTL